MPETEADLVPELQVGMHAWFADDSGEGFREVAHIEEWTAEPHTFERSLAADWVTVTCTDGHIDWRPRYGTHEIWKSGPRPMVGAS